MWWRVFEFDACRLQLWAPLHRTHVHLGLVDRHLQVLMVHLTFNLDYIQTVTQPRVCCLCVNRSCVLTVTVVSLDLLKVWSSCQVVVSIRIGGEPIQTMNGLTNILLVKQWHIVDYVTNQLMLKWALLLYGVTWGQISIVRFRQTLPKI